MRRSPLPAYVPFQLKDFLIQRAALPLLLVAVVVGIPVWGMLRNSPTVFQDRGGSLLATQMFNSGLALFLPLGAFLGGSGLVSGDRQHGYGRFYFSRPIGALQYYLQAYIVHGLAFVALFGAIVAVYGYFTVHFSIHRAMEAAALTFVLVGGVGFLFSALTRFDGGLLVMTYLLAMLLQQLRAAAETATAQLPGWVSFLASILPPVYKMDQVRTHLYQAQAVAPGDVWHVVLYGLGAFVAGAYALRKLPMVR